MKTPWHSLELISELTALPVTWRHFLGPHFLSFKSAFLQSLPDQPARFYPCPNGCPTAHEIIQYGPQEIAAICRCECSSCSDLRLSREEIIPLQLSWPKLAASLARSLDLQYRLVRLDLNRTCQIGSWSASAVPTLLTLQPATAELRPVVAELVARLRQPFILLSPTAHTFDASCRELLHNIGAGHFALDSTVIFTPNGNLVPSKPPSDLFANFAPPPPTALDEDLAQQAFALVQQLDSDSHRKSPSTLTVFRLYCIEELSAAQIGRKCHCSKTTVIDRLNLIRVKTGLSPQRLRRFSPHLNRIEDQLSDPRARRLAPRRFIYDKEPSPTQDAEND